jgi:hypothetical protein
MKTERGNGGFPEPPAGEPVRVVRCSHLTCGRETRIRLPGLLPAEAVRRVVCDGCGRTYDCHLVEEIETPGAGAATTAAPPPHRRSDPSGGRAWRIASFPIAAAAVVGALLLIRGLEDDGTTVERTGQGGSGNGSGARSDAGAEEARLVRQPTFTLALPPGWARTEPPSGATFAARSSDETGEATLFIDREPELDTAAFEARSLQQLRDVAGSAEVAQRVSAPTPEETIVRLRSEAQPRRGEPIYEVTLRSAGPYRYYLSTMLAPGATDQARTGVDLIQRSFFPER